MEITRNGIESGRGPNEWFSGTVFIDRLRASRSFDHEEVAFRLDDPFDPGIFKPSAPLKYRGRLIMPLPTARR